MPLASASFILFRADMIKVKFGKFFQFRKVFSLHISDDVSFSAVIVDKKRFAEFPHLDRLSQLLGLTDNNFKRPILNNKKWVQGSALGGNK